MLSNDDHSGLWAYVIGLIVLVMGGVALSLVADRRFSFSSMKGGLEREIADDAADLLRSREELAVRSNQWQTEGRAAVRATEELAVVNAELATLAESMSERARNLPALEQSLADLEAEFFQYRSAYRRQVWQDAVGETVAELRLENGRQYKDVVISRVTQVGLEIRHANGIARIEAPQLSAQWQERFQWDDEERRSKLRDEWLHRQRMTAPVVVQEPPPVTTPRSSARPEEPGRAEAITAAAAEVRALTERMRILTAELGSARINARSGGQVSVPGSLQTWNARVNQLSAELNRVGVQLKAAEVRLAALNQAPGG